MYLKSFQIANVKCFAECRLDFPIEEGPGGGWFVVLGGNGTGKTTLLQTMALALVGPLESQRLLVGPQGWTRGGTKHGEFSAEVVAGPKDGPRAGRASAPGPYRVKMAVTGEEETELDGRVFDRPQFVGLGDKKENQALAEGPHSPRKQGWMACGYGPFRRLSGQGPRPAPFATLFDEAVALNQCEEWLIQLYIKTIDPALPAARKDRARRSYDAARATIDSLLPAPVRIVDVNSERVRFETLGGAGVSLGDLSDGHRCFLALAVDLLGRIDEAFEGLDSVVAQKAGRPVVEADGVVLIDEVDAHLHPSWQREIGLRLRGAFPNLQFVVTTHSPFVAQVADPGGLFLLRPDETGAVVVDQSTESVEGWRVDQVLTSPLFGLKGTRDLETEALMVEHGGLLAQQRWGKLSANEGRRLGQLEKELGQRLTAPGESAEERQRSADMQAFVDETLARLKAES